MISQFFGVEVDYFFEGLERGDVEGGSETLTPTPNLDYPPTRLTLEMAALTPQLSSRRQKLALEIVREMVQAAPPEH